jgi:hypothetical protein
MSVVRFYFRPQGNSPACSSVYGLEIVVVLGIYFRGDPIMYISMSL